MTTILRSCKYVNLFNGYHLKKFQCALRSNSTVVQINGKISKIYNIILLGSNESHNTILNRIKSKYLIQQLSEKDMSYFMERMYNEASRISNKQYILNDDDVLLLIRCCGNIMKYEMPDGRLKTLDSICQLTKSQGFQFNVKHYNALIEVYLENEKDFSPTNILSEMISNNIQPNVLTYELLLTHYCNKGKVSEANKILHYFKENNIPINENTFSALIIGNAEANDMNGALNILSTMKIMGCIPSSKAYTALLYSYAKIGNIEYIMNTLQICKQKNIYINDRIKLEIIHYLGKHGHSEHIDKIISLLSWDSTVYEYDCLISKFIYHKQIDTAFQLILSVNKVNDKKLVYKFANQFMKSIIKLDLPAEKIIAYINLIEQMKIPAYEITISNCFTGNKAHYCIPFFKAWQKMNVSIKEHFFWPILLQHGLKKDGTIFEIIRTMKDDFDIDPSDETMSHFIIPFLQNMSAKHVIKILIEDTKLPAKRTLNLLSQFYLSNDRLQCAKTCIELSKQFHSKQMLPLEKNNFKSKIDPEKIKYVPHLNHINLAFELRKYSQEENILKAEMTMKELQNFYNYSIGLDKILSYFNLLVKKNRIKDAFQILTDLFKEKKLFIPPQIEIRQKCAESLNLLAEKGSIDDIDKLFNIIKDLKLNITKKMTQSFITIHLLKNNSEEALKAVEKIQKEYGWLTNEMEIMDKFIKIEDVNSLQQFTNFSNKHEGYITTLINLSIAFLRNNRSHESKEVLKSGDMFKKENNLKSIIRKLLLNNEFHVVKDLIQLTYGMKNINRNFLYEVLLEKYSELNKWMEGLELWKQIMNEDMEPSQLILLMLKELLERNNQPQPATIEKFLIHHQEIEYINTSAQIINEFLIQNASPAYEYTNILLSNLTKIGDMKSIGLINKYFYMSNKQVKDQINIFELCENSNQIKSYLEYIDATIKEGDQRQLRNISLSCNYKSLKYFINHPENFKSFESSALQMYASNTKFYQPILTVIGFYCYKNPKKSLNIWNQYVGQSIAQSFVYYNYFVESLLYAGLRDIPLVAESFETNNRLNTQTFNEAFMRAFENQGKYRKGLGILLEHEIKRNEVRRNEKNTLQALV